MITVNTFVNTHRMFIGIAALLLMIGGIGAVDFFSARPHGLAYNVADPTFNRAYWKQEIEDLGPAKAYALFKEKNAKAPVLLQHLASHVIGELLYEKAGIDGVVLCDMTFNFGCYHGFFGQAIAAGGTALISKLDAACVKEYSSLGTGCQHGLGHGILEYVGYTHLNEALKLCKLTTQLVPLLGCTSGVFMEYNTPLVTDSTGSTPAPRKLDFNDPHAPCPGVPSENRASCYFNLGQWYRITEGPKDATLNTLCGGLEGSDRTNCFLGIGSILVAFDGYALAPMVNECDLFSKEDALYCRAGVSWSFYANPAYRAQAPQACAYADAAKQKQCMTLADLTQGLDSSKQ